MTCQPNTEEFKRENLLAGVQFQSGLNKQIINICVYIYIKTESNSNVEFINIQNKNISDNHFGKIEYAVQWEQGL